MNKKSLKTSLKTGFAQISLAAQKIRVAQNFGGFPLAPLARTPMLMASLEVRFS